VEWHKVKNIIILMLALVNGFLLVLVTARQNEARRYERAAQTQAVQALANSGIAVDEGGLVAADHLDPVSIERDVEQEGRMVSALLDEKVAGDNWGGGLYRYQGITGEVSVRAGGEFSAKLYDHPRWQAPDPAAHAVGLLRQIEIEGERIAFEQEGDTSCVTVRQRWGGVPLFSSQLTFLYRDGMLQSIDGVLLIPGRVNRERRAILTLPTALLHFLDGVLETGDVCSAILSMEVGYRAIQSLSSAVRLSPVWFISSNTANYYLDAVTGELTRSHPH